MKNFILISLLLSSSLGLCVETISLKPILDELNVSYEVIEEFPGRLPTIVKSSKPWGIFPVQALASTPDGIWVALRFHEATIPKNSKLSNQVVLASIESGKPLIRKVIDPIAFKHMQNPRIRDMQFIDDKILRIEVYGDDPEKKADTLGYLRNYQFFDLKTGATFDLQKDLNIGEIITARAFSKYHYFITHNQGGRKRFSVIKYNPHNPGEVLFLGGIQDQQAAYKIQHAPREGVDGQERDIARFDNDRVWVRFSDTELMMIEKDHIRFQTWEARYPQSMPVEWGGGLFSRVNEDAHLMHITDKENKVVREYKNIDPDVLWPLTKVTGGFVHETATHPNYGFQFFGDDGKIQELTPKGYRMIHFDVHQERIVGLTEYQVESGDLNLVRISMPGVAPLKSSALANAWLRREKMAGHPVPFPIVFRVDSGRYLIVRKGDKTLAVVDQFMDEQIIKEIPLLDPEHFEIVNTDGAILIKYPKKNIQRGYQKHTFQLFGEYSCNDDLLGDDDKKG